MQVGFSSFCVVLVVLVVMMLVVFGSSEWVGHDTWSISPIHVTKEKILFNMGGSFNFIRRESGHYSREGMSVANCLNLRDLTNFFPFFVGRRYLWLSMEVTFKISTRFNFDIKEKYSFCDLDDIFYFSWIQSFW